MGGVLNEETVDDLPASCPRRPARARGETVIAPQRQAAGDFSAGVASVVDADGATALIDAQGARLWPR